MRSSLAVLLSAFFVVIHALAALPPHADVSSQQSELWKRRGGGGGGGGRGGGSSGGSSSGGRGGSSSGSSGSSGGRTSSSSTGRGSSSSSSGGRTITGSGPAPAYGGGRFYGGGAAVPYKAGSTSPSGISPFLFGAGAALAFWPGLWLSGAYLYHYNHPYSYYNASSKANETKPVTCGCDPYAVCGCDENGDTQYLSDLIGNGTNLNSSLVSVATVNNTQRILINGTLPNGTTAAGGDEDAFSGAAGLQMLLNSAGWWPVVAIVSTMVFAA